MNKPAIKHPRPKTAIQAQRVPVPKSTRVSSGKTAIKADIYQFRHKLLMLCIEAFCLMAVTVYAIMVLLGYSANWWSGTSLFSHLLPFAVTILALMIAVTALIILWWQFRGWLYRTAPKLAPLLPISMVILLAWFGWHSQFGKTVAQFRTLVGGKLEVSRVTLAHQVYAAYRRYDDALLQQMILRAEPYNPAITEAAKAFGLDKNLLLGVAATESSFLPRDSHDGGHGLFQITQVPKSVMQVAAKHLAVNKPDVYDPKHNAYIAAATLKFYLEQMKNDLFLGLLAYNIGPANGGLRFIMQQYGATDFITIQPYLQQLPRDYPIRVLTFALAFRLWQKEGKLMAYEEGENAMRIQAIGIPGLHMDM